MGVYDTVIVKCPNCGVENDFQSKSGDCTCATYTLENCPYDVLFDINRHFPCICECCNLYEVDREHRKAILVLNEQDND